MCIEHGDAVSRADGEPIFQTDRLACIERMQHQRWKRKIVNKVDLFRDSDLILIIGMDLHQRLDSEGMRLRREPRNKIECFGYHETGGARLLDRVAGRVETNRSNAGGLK